MKKLLLLLLLLPFFSQGQIISPGDICIGQGNYTVTDNNPADTGTANFWILSDTNAVIVSQTNTTVTLYGHKQGNDSLYFVFNSTLDTDKIQLKIYNLVGAITGKSFVCTNATDTLTDATLGTWSSSNTLVATVGSSTGIVWPVQQGAVTITFNPTSTLCGYYSPTFFVTIDTTVLPAITYTNDTLCAGTTMYYANAKSPGTWSSSNSAIATVYSAGPSGGIVTGVAAGTATITYTHANTCGTLNVTAPVVVLGQAEPITGATTMCYGSTQTLTDGTTAGTWSSSNTAIATIGSATGIVSPVASGSVVFTFTPTASKCNSGSYTFAVMVDTLLGAITYNRDTVCVGMSVAQFTATQPGGVWSSGNYNIASVDQNGVVYPQSQNRTVITYTLTNICGTLTATNNITCGIPPGPISGPGFVKLGSTTTYTDASTGGTWSVSQASINTINPITGAFTANSKVVNTDTIYYATQFCGDPAIVVGVGGTNAADSCHWQGYSCGSGPTAYACPVPCPDNRPWVTQRSDQIDQTNKLLQAIYADGGGGSGGDTIYNSTYLPQIAANTDTTAKYVKLQYQSGGGGGTDTIINSNLLPAMKTDLDTLKRQTAYPAGTYKSVFYDPQDNFPIFYDATKGIGVFRDEVSGTGVFIDQVSNEGAFIDQISKRSVFVDSPSGAGVFTDPVTGQGILGEVLGTTPSGSSPAINVNIGQNPVATVGETKIVNITPTVTAASAYTAGYVVGGVMTFNIMRTNGGTGQLMNVLVKVKDTNQAGFTLLIFSQNPSNGAYTDDAAFTFNATDFTYLIREVSVTRSNYVSAGAYSVADLTAIAKTVDNTSSGTNLYMIAITTTTPTFGAAGNLTFSMGILQD
jgi:uncharacterized protein YjdB